MSNTVATVSIELMARADADCGQWVHLLPAGTFRGRDGRGPYKLGDSAEVIHASREHAGRLSMPIDYDHAIDLATPKGVAAPAAGWIDALQSRRDGIWGRVTWTPRATEQLANREYRYLSPVFKHGRDGTVSSLLRASLTNNPNLDQLTALASSMEPTEMEKLAELRKLLDLPDDADIEAILAKINKLKSAASTTMQSARPDPAKFVPIGDFERVVARVNQLDQGISLQAAQHHVEAVIANGQMLPFLKDWAISLCAVNKPEFDKFIERSGGKVYNQFFGTLMPKGSLPPPARSESNAGLSHDEVAIASRMGLSAADFAKNKSLNIRQD